MLDLEIVAEHCLCFSVAGVLSRYGPFCDILLLCYHSVVMVFWCFWGSTLSKLWTGYVGGMVTGAIWLRGVFKGGRVGIILVICYR